MKSFSTSDFPLSASLVVKGYNIEKTEKDYTKRVTFHFKRTLELDKIIQEYWTGTLQLEPKTFYQALKYLKGRIHNAE